MLFDKLERIADELPGCQMTSIVSFDNGLSLASVTRASGEDAAGADAFHSDIYRQIANAMRELGTSQTVESIVIQGERSVFVSAPLGSSGYFWHVATDPGTTLGYTQAVMRKWRDEIETSISDFLGV